MMKRFRAKIVGLSIKNLARIMVTVKVINIKSKSLPFTKKGKVFSFGRIPFVSAK
jgi:hypothetical protein